MSQTKHCKDCNMIKTVKDFWTIKDGKPYLYCKPCAARRAKNAYVKGNMYFKRRTDSPALLIHGHQNLMALEQAMRVAS